MQPEIEIAGRLIGPHHQPFIIAEMSANHQGDLARALAIIDAAAEAGADAVKLQTYTPDTMTLDLRHSAFVIDTPSLWQGSSLYELYEKAQTPWDWHKILFDHCCKRGVIGFSSPFDESSVDLLETLQVPCYKIASLEILDHQLLKRVAETRKPIFMSTGAARLQEIEEAMQVIARNGGGRVVLLKCTSAYPAPFDQANLRTIEHLKQYFGPLVGLSDHTLGSSTSLAAIALGASVIEKHFTLKRSDGGVDAAFSLEPEELKQLTRQAKEVAASLGRVYYGATAGEALSLSLRRSLYVTRDVVEGERVDETSVRAIRPGAGLAPKYWPQVKGKAFIADLPAGTPLAFSHLQSDPSQSLPRSKVKTRRVVAIVQARMGSTRLPGKVLLPLGNRTVLEWVIARLRCCHLLDEVAVATSEESADDAIVEFGARHQVRVIRGSHEDLLSRYLQAARELEGDLIVRITADCPLLDPELVDAFIKQYLEAESLAQVRAQSNDSSFESYHGVSNARERTFPRGLDIEVISLEALEDLSHFSLTAAEKEHVTLGLYARGERYKFLNPISSIDYSHYRWTLDTPLDYVYLLQIYESLEPAFTQLLQEVSLPNRAIRQSKLTGAASLLTQGRWSSIVCRFLEANPGASHLNASQHQKAVY